MLPHTEIGFIIKSRGHSGQMIARILHPFAPAMSTLAVLLVDIHGDLVPFWIDHCQPGKLENEFEIHFEGITERESASKLIHRPIFALNRDLDIDIQPPEEAHPLIGYWIQNQHNEPIGFIDQIEIYPEQEMALVNVNNEIKLIPLAEEYIVWIDDQNQTLQMDIPEGLLEL